MSLLTRLASVGLLSLVATASLAQLAPTPSGRVTPPPLVIRSDNQAATIWAHERAGAPAANGTVNLGSTTGAGATAAGVNNRGSNLQVNSSTVAQPSAIVTMGMAQCPALSPPRWPDASTGPCQGANIPVTVHNQVVPATDPTGFPGYEGAANFACSNGAWQLQPGHTCTATAAPTCPTQTLYWTGSHTCAASFTSSVHGTALTRASTNGNTGSATFTCSNGAWALSANGGCAAPAMSVTLSSMTAAQWCSAPAGYQANVSGGVPPYSYYWYSSSSYVGFSSQYDPWGNMRAPTYTGKATYVSGMYDNPNPVTLRVTDSVGTQRFVNFSAWIILCP